MQLTFWALRIRDIEMKNRIKELRKKKHLTLKELSQQLKNTGFNVSPDTLGKYERAEREPKLKTWEKLADFFHVPVSYLQGTTSYIEKYELWACSRCGKHFFATEEPKHCPYCGSKKRLGYGTSKIISF